MERKKLIKPITVVKVKKFLAEVEVFVCSGGYFSIDKLSREHSLGTATGKAMVDLGMISRSEKGNYTFGDTAFNSNDKKDAIKVIEKVRISSIEMRNNKSASTHAGGIALSDQETSAVDNKNIDSDKDINLNRKSLKTPEFTLILEKIFSKMNDGKQSDLFDGINNVHNERIHVASAISSGVWASLGMGDSFPRMNEDAIREVNAKIAFTTDDLMDQILNFKKS